MGRAILCIRLQDSGYKEHLAFLLHSDNVNDSGIKFLAKFCLDGAQRSFVVKGTDVVYYNYCNSIESVTENRGQLVKCNDQLHNHSQQNNWRDANPMVF